jgi:hypothetical protein
MGCTKGCEGVSEVIWIVCWRALEWLEDQMFVPIVCRVQNGEMKDFYANED